MGLNGHILGPSQCAGLCDFELELTLASIASLNLVTRRNA